VVHGEGTVKGVLCYAGTSILKGWGSVVTVADDGTVIVGQPTSGTILGMAYGAVEASTYLSPAVYVFAQGVITSWLWILRGDVKFGPAEVATFDDLAAWAGDWPTRTPVQPEMTLGNPATATEWAYAQGTGDWHSPTVLGPEHRAPLGHLAILRHPALVLPDCKFPKLQARLVGELAQLVTTGTAVDYYAAQPAAMLRDIVEDTIIGFGLTGILVTNLGPDGVAASSFDSYVSAARTGLPNGYLLARVWDGANAGTESIQEILDACDSSVLWTGSNLKVIPLGETAMTGYTPPTTVVAFTDDDFILDDPNADPIEASRVPDSDVPTVVPVEFLPWYSLDGTTTTAEALNSAKASTAGVVRTEPVSILCIPEDIHAQEISQIRAQRGIFNRTTFRWRSSWRFLSVEPGDLVTLTHVMMGLDSQLVRVTSVEETDDGLAFEAIEWHSGVSVTEVGMPQTSDGIGNNPVIPDDNRIAKTEIANILSDGILSPAEKPNFVSITNRLYWDLHAAWTSSWYNQWFGSPPEYTPYELLEMLLAYVGFDYRWFAIEAYWTGADIATQRGLLTAWLGSSTIIPDPAAFRTEMDGYLSQAATYQKALIDYLASGPGVMKALGNTGVTAVTGTPSSSTFLRGDGTWAPLLPAGRQVVWGSVAPAAGVFTQGDVCWNSAAAVGQPKGWQCTVSGTPGTWVSMGVL
jgi:hypothetical protein